MGGKLSGHVLESLGGSRDQTVVSTYLGKKVTVRDEVGCKAPAGHVLESLENDMNKIIPKYCSYLGGSRDQTVTPTAPPGLNSAQLASRTGSQLMFPVKNPFCQAQIKY